MNSRMKYLRFYLSGPIEMVDDRGTNWRQEITHKLISIGVLPSNILDPTNNPTRSKDLAEEFDKINLAKSHNDRKAVHRFCKHVRHVDLRMVDISDCLIVGLFGKDGICPTTYGTTAEIDLAVAQRKPIYVYSNLEWQALPHWYLGALPTETHFFDINALVGQLISDISINPDRRWVFLDNLYLNEDED